MNILKYIFIGIITILKFPFFFTKYFFIGFITIITILPRYIIIGLKLIFSKKNNNNHEIKRIEKNFIPITILTLSIITYLISIFILTRWYVQNKRTQNFTEDFSKINQEETKESITQPNQYEDITPIIPNQNPNNQTNDITNETSKTQTPNTNYINVNLNYYTQKNTETVGWLQVNGTKVDYPIVQHEDNDFYLNHDFYKRKTKAGWIFGDYRNNFKNFNNNTIIYGHNLINNTMFGTIPDLLNKNWLANKNNHYIKLSTLTTNTIWQVFSVYKIIPTTDYLQINFNSTTSYQNFLNTVESRSIYNFNLNLDYTDKIITLSTCDDTGTKRVVVHAKLINIETK